MNAGWFANAPGVALGLVLALPWALGLILVLARPATGSWRSLAAIGFGTMAVLALASTMRPIVFPYLAQGFGYWSMTAVSLLMGAFGIVGAGFIVAAMISGPGAYPPPNDPPPVPPDRTA